MYRFLLKNAFFTKALFGKESSLKYVLFSHYYEIAAPRYSFFIQLKNDVPKQFYSKTSLGGKEIGCNRKFSLCFSFFVSFLSILRKIWKPFRISKVNYDYPSLAGPLLKRLLLITAVSIWYSTLSPLESFILFLPKKKEIFEKICETCPKFVHALHFLYTI